jgi:mRNA-degrading endonuclease RelE of RelBE toxin-antitoxin system
MAYAIEFTHQAEEDLARLDKTIAQQIANRIDWLSQNMTSISPTPLKGRISIRKSVY